MNDKEKNNQTSEVCYPSLTFLFTGTHILKKNSTNRSSPKEIMKFHNVCDHICSF